MKRLLSTFLLIFCAIILQAEIKLPALVCDNMVLQQNTQVKLWGQANANSALKITVSWDKSKYNCQADKDGYWEVLVKTPMASKTPQSVTIADKDSKIILNNILIGEVWFASGQSNMEMPLNGFWNSPINNANSLIATARTRPYIRMFTVQIDTARTRQWDCRGTWQESTPANIQRWGATAYHFAMHLNAALDIPVGIVNCSRGGTKVEGWMPIEDIKDYPDVRLEDASDPKVNDYLRPFLYYYAMMYPCRNYTVKGIIWYQGCSNVDIEKTYADKLSKMVKRLREEKGLGDIPFYEVEIAPYDYGNANAINGAQLREQQFKALSLIPNSGLVCTNDLVRPDEIKNIHPSEKGKVGERLASLALVKTYGEEGICCTGPSFKSVEYKDGKAFVSFNDASEGFFPWYDIEGFEIADADKKFVAAQAAIDQNSHIVSVWNDSIKNPAYVRYCFKNFQIGNLHNHRGFPVFPFRTDTDE